MEFLSISDLQPLQMLHSQVGKSCLSGYFWERMLMHSKGRLIQRFLKSTESWFYV